MDAPVSDEDKRSYGPIDSRLTSAHFCTVGREIRAAPMTVLDGIARAGRETNRAIYEISD